MAGVQRKHSLNEVNEVVDASIDENVLFDYKYEEEITATAALMKTDINCKVGFYEVVVPSLVAALVDEFRFHVRMTKKTFEVLTRALSAKGAIPAGNRFGRSRFHYRSRFWLFFAVHVEMEVHIKAYKCSHARSHVVDSQKRELSGHAYGSKLAQSLELVDKSK